MIFSLRATLEDGREFLAEVDGRDIRRYEAASRTSFLTDHSYTQLHDLAFYALDRTRAVNGMTKAEWDLRCVMVKEEQVEAVDPTQPTPTDGTS